MKHSQPQSTLLKLKSQSHLRSDKCVHTDTQYIYTDMYRYACSQTTRLTIRQMRDSPELNELCTAISTGEYCSMCLACRSVLVRQLNTIVSQNVCVSFRYCFGVHTHLQMQCVSPTTHHTHLGSHIPFRSRLPSRPYSGISISSHPNTEIKLL